MRKLFIMLALILNAPVFAFFLFMAASAFSPYSPENRIADWNQSYDMATLAHTAWNDAEWKEHEPEPWAERSVNCRQKLNGTRTPTR